MDAWLWQGCSRDFRRHVACLRNGTGLQACMRAASANHSDRGTIARICNAATGKKTRFYVPDSVQHCTIDRCADPASRVQ